MFDTDRYDEYGPGYSYDPDYWRVQYDGECEEYGSDYANDLDSQLAQLNGEHATSTTLLRSAKPPRAGAGPVPPGTRPDADAPRT